ncbi:MAG: flagellar basal-body MS-ring/collar protein FliF [Stellaceae bacterium]
MAVLDADFAKTFTARARGAFVANRRLTVLAAIAAAATLIAMLVLWSGEPDYSVLYAGLSGPEGGAAITQLQKLNIPYRVSEGGRVILVPTAALGQARLKLAVRGVPKTDGDAWDLLDNEALGVSPFVEQVHYVRGLEATLSHTVGEVDGVLSAQVTLALPKRTGFLDDEPKPSASVLLRLAPGLRLSKPQVSGIVGLVASSVPGLARGAVTVVDQDGNVLTTRGGAGLQEVPQQLAIIQQVDTKYERLISDILMPIVGSQNFRVSVDSDIDFSQSKQSLVRYGQGHLLSEDQTQSVGGTGGTPMGIPGALSNQPPATPSTAPATARKAAATPAKESHNVSNYDIDKTIQYLQAPPWRLKAISAAVLLNDAGGRTFAPARMKSIKTLVQSVIGANAGHVVTVVDLPFDQAKRVTSLPTPLWQQAWVHAAAQNALLALAGLLALFGGLFPILRWLKARPGLMLPAMPAMPAVPPRGEGGAGRRELGANDATATAAGGAQTSSIDFSGLSSDTFKVDVDAVRKIVANDPDRTAQVIKEWISRGIPGNSHK